MEACIHNTVSMASGVTGACLMASSVLLLGLKLQHITSNYTSQLGTRLGGSMADGLARHLGYGSSLHVKVESTSLVATPSKVDRIISSCSHIDMRPAAAATQAYPTFRATTCSSDKMMVPPVRSFRQADGSLTAAKPPRAALATAAAPESSPVGDTDNSTAMASTYAAPSALQWPVHMQVPVEQACFDSQWPDDSSRLPWHLDLALPVAEAPQ